MKSLTIAILSLITLTSLFSLVSGAAYLEVPLPGGLPAGNAIATLGLICPSAIAVLLSTPRTVLRAVSLGAFCIAAAWLPVSIMLAGNLALNFSGWRGSIWLSFSAVAYVTVLCALVWSLVNRIVAMRRRGSAA